MRPKSFGRVISWYVQLFQGTPLLMQLFLAYFGLALFGVQTTPLLAASLCLTLYASAYLTETWRGCVESIPVSTTPTTTPLPVKPSAHAWGT